MTGWTDIDGTNVMAGSPGKTDQFEVALNGVLGEWEAPYTMNLKKLREIAVKADKPDLVERCDLAKEMLEATRRLFSWTSVEGDSLYGCREAVEIVRPRT